VTVEVTFVDGATGQLIGRSTMAAEDLPEVFGPATELHIGEAAWRVESADPETREECARSGVLRLVLRKAPPVETVQPAKLKFSMSSICDMLPPDGAPCGNRLPLVIKEDLWRDVELVGPGHEDAVAVNFAAIRRIHTERRIGPGFFEIHLRTEPRAPLDNTGLTVAQLAAALGTEQRNPVTIDGYAGCVPGGFALPVSGGLVVYGYENDGAAVVAGIDHSAGDASAATASLFALMSEHRLGLVDWRNCLRIDDESVLDQWLGEAPRHLWH
jgi:hypothetical protein